MRITYKADAIQLNEEAIINAIAAKAEKHLAELGEHVADVARGRAPIGKDMSAHPRSFQRVSLRNEKDFPQGREGSEAEHRRQVFNTLFSLGRSGQIKALKQAGGKTRDKGLLQFFRGTRAQGTLKQSPTELRVKGNAIVGAFQHQPGTLRKSIRFVGVEREGNRVVATVRAHAPYAMAVHDGFTHKGGRDHQGTATRVKENPFLKNALVNIQSRLAEPSAYEG